MAGLYVGTALLADTKSECTTHLHAEACKGSCHGDGQSLGLEDHLLVVVAGLFSC